MSKNRYLYEDLRDVREAYDKLAALVLEQLKRVLIPILDMLTRLLNKLSK